jgi:hypothetical protein
MSVRSPTKRTASSCGTCAAASVSSSGPTQMNVALPASALAAAGELRQALLSDPAANRADEELVVGYAELGAHPAAALGVGGEPFEVDTVARPLGAGHA